MVAVSDALIQKAQAIVSHPKFGLARATHCIAMFKLYKDIQIARFLVNETGRALIANICIYMDLTFEPSDPRSGLTVRKIQKICSDRGVASPGRVFAFVKMLQLSGYLESVAASDKRFKFLRPTQKLHSYRSELMDSIFAALDHINTAKNYSRRAAAQVVDDRILMVSGKDFFAGLFLLDHHPDIKLFADRDGGYHFLLKILREARLFDGEIEANAEIAISLLDVSQRSALSRSHLRSILVEAERRELISIDTRAGYRISLRPKLIAKFDEQVALLLAYYADIIDHRLDEPCPQLFQND